MRIAAVGDLHCGASAQGAFESLFAAMSRAADALVLAGDLTDLGLPEEAQTLARELRTASPTPVLAVLGNHDFESGAADKVRMILEEAGVIVLDGTSHVVGDVGFAGVKGLGGGFGQRALQPWGEDIMKRLVHEAVAEALKLETALARLRTPTRVAVLHYAPVRETVEGEPPEIFPFLGSSRLEEPLVRYSVAVTVHGHAHHGSPEGRTQSGAPVYNVCYPLLRAASPEQPFRVIDLGFADGREAGQSASATAEAEEKSRA
ncbi:MAG TPA: metallophosphoesterase [Methylomirabilota bacterium]|nr:metallophosphoesterase [Methylomirabilota bacterium]